MEVAVSAARWVVGRALAPVTDGLLEAWAASSGLGPNVDALQVELLYVQAMLENARGREEARGGALRELLGKLRQLAYGAEDVLDELEYFRLQDELEGTHEAATDDDADGVRGAARDVRHTAKVVLKQLGRLCCSCGGGGGPRDGDGHGDGAKPGAVCCATCWPCASAKQMEPGSSSTTTNHDRAAGGGRGRTRRRSFRAAGKFFPCCYGSSSPAPSVLQPAAGSDADGSGVVTDPITAPAPKLEFPRVEISKRIKGIVDELRPLGTKVATILNLDLLDSNRSIVQEIAATLLADQGRTPILPNRSVLSKPRPISTSDMSEPEFFGRQREVTKIIHGITEGEYSDRDLTVVPIVGLGGMGKTTLAQHVYKQVLLEKYFEVKAWICVSFNFSVGRLTKEIAESIPKLQDERGDESPEKLIEQRLKSKRFLLVLDDMWNCGDEEEWNRLIAPLRKTQTKGNIILVTTRSPALAQTVKSETVDAVELEGLDDQSYWNLFLAFVFDGKGSENQLLLDIGKEIVKKLKGSPLAAKTVGRLLRNHLDAHHWERVLESKEWEFQTGDHDIMPALKLSYDYLPFHLQQCFSYCTLFPQDYKFDRNELIYWWTGLDILHFSGGQNKSIEDIGLGYLKDLEDHGFFMQDKLDGEPCYIIHDLLHDLGIKVASPECISIDRANVRSVETWTSVRHLSIIIDGADDSDGIMTTKLTSELRKLKKNLKMGNLQTLTIFGEGDESLNGLFVDLIKNANGLRVLHLSKMIPHMELSAIHLRYLSLGNIDCLPSMLSRFYLLRILNLQEEEEEVQHGVLRMPKDMSNLTKLRHFVTNNYEFHSKICNVGKLQFLQELKRFEVNKESKGFELKQVGNLAELRELGIYHLERIHTKEEAALAQLTDKTYLNKLTLDWQVEVPIGERDTEGVVLDRLEPARNLQELCISGHGGRFCPTWLSSKLSVKVLESLDLDGVSWETLPWLGHMLVLHELILSNLCAIKEFGPSHFGSISAQSFCNLYKLHLISLEGLQRFDLGNNLHLFSKLQELIIEGCPKLLSLPFEEHICYPPREDEEGKTHRWLPNLQKLVIRSCPKIVLLPPIPWIKTLCSVAIEDVGSPVLESLDYSSSGYLQIVGKDQLHTLDEVLLLSNLSGLQHLNVRSCPPLEVKQLRMLTSLKELTVKNSHHVLVPSESEGEEAQCQVPVEMLTIDGDMHATAKEVSQLLSHLPNLSELTIRNCNKKAWLGVQVDTEEVAPALAPEGEEKEKIEDGLLLFPAHLSSFLRELEISSCPELSLLAASPLVDHHGHRAGGGLQPMRCLQGLKITECPKFLSAYETTSSSPSAYLGLSHAGNLGTLKPLSNLTSLDQLFIQGCGEDLRGEGLLTLITQGQLTYLYIFNSPSFFIGSDLMRGLPDFQDPGQPLRCPPKLQILQTDDAAGVLAAPICTLLSSSLIELNFGRNQQVERLGKEQEDALRLLTSLQELGFYFCDRLQCLPAGLHTLPRLKTLTIMDCPGISCLPEDGLPISLQELQVSSCGNEELKQQCRNFVRDHPGIRLKI